MHHNAIAPTPPFELLRQGALTTLALAALAGASVHAQTHTTCDPAGACTIVVNTTTDPAPANLNHTCDYTFGAATLFPAPDGLCTLRRALREAGSRREDFAGDMTILFQLSTSDPNYISSVGVWRLPVDGSQPFVLENAISSVEVDGRVLVQGPAPTTRSVRGVDADLPVVYIDTPNSLEVEKAGNTFQNLGFLGGGALFFKEPDNTLRDSTWGLRPDGVSIDYEAGAVADVNLVGENGVFGNLDADGTTVENNIIVGASVSAIEINSGTTGVEIRNNWIGTAADGNAPAVPNECTTGAVDPNDWYGGDGISLAGTGAVIEGNILSGLQTVRSPTEGGPVAIQILGQDHIVQNNFIGVNADGGRHFICGTGIQISGQDQMVLDNTIVGARENFDGTVDSAMVWSDSAPSDFGGNTVRGNLVIDGPSDVYAMTELISGDIRLFQPGEITSFVGRSISGGNAPVGTLPGECLASSCDCPNCTIDFYLDDLNDPDQDAMVHLGSTTANASGDFAFVLPLDVLPTQAVRTTSTATSANVIGGSRAGTTSVLSNATYQPADFGFFIFADGFESGDALSWSSNVP